MNVKKLLKGSLMALMLPTMLLSCSENNNEPNESEMSAAKKAIIAPTNRLPTLQWIWRVCALI